MKKSKGLVIIQIDGLGYDYLQQALQQGHLPFVQSLIDDEGYEALRYRCGLPSVTPFAQAGILYGDNDEIPSFRWWDKESGVPVSFGSFSSFKHVAHKYFRDCTPLTAGGASIATCYPDSVKIESRVRSREHGHYFASHAFSQRRVLEKWVMNPIHLMDWMRRGLWEIGKANAQYLYALVRGQPGVTHYVVAELLEEILLHHLTRFAAIQAMKENFPIIYATFYAYDETAHAFGPKADFSFRILDHVDHTIQRIAKQRQRAGADARAYELIVLSDHGQVETIPYQRKYRRRFGELVAEWLPTYEVEEFKGVSLKRAGAIDGHIAITYTGGLAHLYFKDISWRLPHDEIEERYPGLINKIAHAPGIGFVLTRNNATNILTTREQQTRFEASRLTGSAREFLARYDEADLIARQLHKLNSFERSGDLIIFGAYTNSHQINFETQVGGHGSIGGAQMFPFIVAKREWKFDTSKVIDATGIYPLITRLHNQLHIGN